MNALQVIYLGGNAKTMTKDNHLPIFIAGVAIGAAAAVVVLDAELRSNVGAALRQGTQRMSEAISDAEAAWKKGENVMSSVKDKVKDKIDDAASVTKKAIDKTVDKSKEAAHKAGEQLEKGGKRLQDA